MGVDRDDRTSSSIRSSRCAHDGHYWTPNGNHRLQALKKLGRQDGQSRSLVPDARRRVQILALNTEKAHNLREKSLETIRMARALAGQDAQAESEASFTFEFEQPSFLTLGICYEERPRFSGGAYQSILRRADELSRRADGKGAQGARAARPARCSKLDDAVGAAVEKLKAKG